MIGNESSPSFNAEQELRKEETGPANTDYNDNATAAVDPEDVKAEETDGKILEDGEGGGEGSGKEDDAAAGNVKDDGNQVESIVNLYVTVYSFNLFTITDGAIRVIILLYANELGFTPIEIAMMFSMYELAGVITNMFGGVAAARYGLKSTLLLSLILQIIGLVLLLVIPFIFGHVEDRTLSSSEKLGITAYITFCQMISGIAKDFMKVSCKTVPKLVTKHGENETLFKLVAWVTGLKNSFKGLGHILGAVLIQFAGFEAAIGFLLAVIVCIAPVPIIWMSRRIGKGSKKIATFTRAALKQSPNVNWLSFARFFLFGSRDTWFEIAAPIFLRSILQWPEFTVGLFMGSYIIIYGNLQTSTSKLYKSKKNNDDASSEQVSTSRCGTGAFDGPPTEKSVPGWAYANAVQLLIWGTILYPLYVKYVDTDFSETYRWSIGGVLIFGLVCFAVLFAVNSAVHSYLIVLYAGKNKASISIGAYYSANAGGRLVGTLLSGIIYQFTEEDFGLSVCLWVASLFMFAAGVVSYKLEPLEKVVEQSSAKV